MARRIDLISMPPFDAHGSPSTLDQRWKQWLTKFQTYFTASGITDDTQKRAMLLYLAGPAVKNVFETLPDTGEAKDFKVAHEKRTEYFTPKNERFRRADSRITLPMAIVTLEAHVLHWKKAFSSSTELQAYLVNQFSRPQAFQFI